MSMSGSFFMWQLVLVLLIVLLAGGVIVYKIVGNMRKRISKEKMCGCEEPCGTISTGSHEGRGKRVSICVKGMHCEQCAARVKGILSGVKDVVEVKVNLKEEMVYLIMDEVCEDIDVLSEHLNEMGKRLEEAGFKLLWSSITEREA